MGTVGLGRRSCAGGVGVRLAQLVGAAALPAHNEASAMVREEQLGVAGRGGRGW